MNRLLALASVVVFVFCSGCGGDSQESLTAESVSTMREMVATFDGIKDEASAKSAKPKLKSVVERMNSIKERQSKLPFPTEAEGNAIIAKYGTQMDELQKKMAGHMLRIGFDPKIRAQLDDIDMKKTTR